MNFFERYKSSSKRWNCFSKIDVLGSFDFYTSIISLDSVRPADFDDLANKTIKSREENGPVQLSFSAYEAASKIMPLAIHEYTHFIDSTSTAWGLKHLSMMNNAYLADDRRFGGSETGFHHAKKFFDEVRTLRLPDYYTVVEKNVDPQLPWRNVLTVGFQFGSDGLISDRPIIFARFDKADGTPIARSPLSSIAILEASAMFQEISSTFALIDQLKEDEKIVERNKYTREVKSIIYNPKLTEYTACAHVVANTLNCDDIFVAYRISATLGRIILNIPERLYRKIKVTPEVGEKMGWSSGTDKVIKIINTGLQQCNPGVLFYLLTQLLPTNSASGSANLKSGIESALSLLGTNLEEIQQEAIGEIDFLADELSRSKINSIRKLGLAGKENFSLIDLVSPGLKFNLLQLPPVLLSDGTSRSIFTTPQNKLGTIDLEMLYDELVNGQIWVERFSEACG
ncbi:hypothetical protein [Pseudoduganella namucuonensis]|uniref:Uncharacterized protein n=1 Tax=Pseudoduganella namucuonensis TaxID=1035707 RepID=A0A1I7M0W4_9BURK|nr:hypothetical protein [Pseudoduganella namucuonensis]SFV15604.1 hypothetical protein SAMN05216552_10475 [Pseudoduganella namucuonensis]